MKDLAINDEQAALVSNGQGNSAMASDAAIAHQRWQQIKAEVQQDQEKMQFAHAISKCAIEVVSRTITTGAHNAAGHCHANVREQVKLFGGKQVFGWQIACELTDGAAMKGCIYAIFHSNWLDDNDVLWDIAAEVQTPHLFLPDPMRVFDFDKAMGYNNRLAFLSKGGVCPLTHRTSLCVTRPTTLRWGTYRATVALKNTPYQSHVKQCWQHCQASTSSIAQAKTK
jgi:hypothetical protein